MSGGESIPRGHKYIRRTGTPGNYKYWYKLPDGRIVTGDDAAQKRGRAEHVKRLIAAKRAGHHDMSHQQIAEMTGHPLQKVGSLASNVSNRGHDFSDHHMKESKHTDVDSDQYRNKIATHLAEDDAATGTSASTAAAAAERERTGGTPARRRSPARDAARDAARAETPLDRRDREAREGAARERAAREAAESGRTSGPGVTPQEVSQITGMQFTNNGGGHFIRQSDSVQLQKLANGKWKVKTQDTDWSQPFDGFQAALDSVGQGAQEDPEAARQAEIDKLVSKLKTEHGLDLSAPTAAEQPAAVADSTKRATAAAQPTAAEQPAAVAESTQRATAAQTPPRSREEHIARQHQAASSDPSRQPGGDVFTSASSEGAALRTAHRNTPGSTPITASGHPVSETHTVTEPRRTRETHTVTEPSSEPRLRPAAIEGTAVRDLHRADPDFAESDAHVQEAVRQQRAGVNPYLQKARENYQKIKAAGHYNATPTSQKRENKVKNFLAAIDQVKLNGQEMTEPNVLAAYKQKMGSNRISVLPKDDVEKGLFYTVDEILNNPPIDIEVERMKRGFARKQFERIEPFLKDSFTNSHPGAPPPFPTFNDLKSWAEHGSERPASMSWTTPTGRAGGVTKAMPQEFFDSAVKIDGKPQMPPGDLPLHLMPVWNYTVKKAMEPSTRPEQKNPYASQTPQRGEGGKISMEMQAQQSEGILYNAVRKYVVMRGGPNELVDIPSLNLSEVGMTHSDIFKAEPQMSKSMLKRILQTKIVDPTALVPFIDAEIKKPTKKSFALVIDPDADYVPGESIAPMEIIKSVRPAMAMVVDIKKARIDKIQRIIHARKSANR